MKVLFLLLLFLTPNILFGQAPYSYQLSEKDGLPSNVVFDMHLSKEGFLYAGTFMGLVKYDGRKHEKIFISDQRKAIAGLQELNNNDIYFLSFSGQVYCYQYDSVRVIKNLKVGYPSLTKLSEDKIIFSSRNGFYTYISNTKEAKFHSLPVLDTSGKDKKSVMLGTVGQGVLIRCQNEIFLVDSLFSIKKIKCPDELKNRLPSFRLAFELNQKDYFLGGGQDKRGVGLYSVENNIIHLKKAFQEIDFNQIQNVSLQANELFILTKAGYYKLHKNLVLEKGIAHVDKAISGLKRVGNRQIISSTNEGIWITPDSTLREAKDIVPEGIVPFLHTYNNTLYYLNTVGESHSFAELHSCFPKNHFTNVNVTKGSSMLADQLGNIFSQKKEMQHLQLDNYELRKAKKSKVFSAITYLKELDLYLVCYRNLFGLITNRASTSNWINTNFEIQNIVNIDFLDYPTNRLKDSLFILYDEQAFESIYDHRDSSIYLQTLTGLYHFKSGKKKTIIENDKAVYSNLVRASNGTIYSNSVEGLYRIIGDEISKPLTLDSGLCSNAIKNLKLVNDTLLIIGDKFIQLYEEKAGFFKTFTTRTNLPAGQILDVSLRQGIIYIGTRQGFYTAPVVSDKEAKLTAFIRYVQAGEVRWPRGEDIPFDRNDVVFNINGVDLFNRGAFHYEYRLLGSNNNQWIEQDANFNDIRFSSLSEGDYTLQLKVVSDFGKESQVTEYPFTIKPPFVRSWFFYLLCFLFALGILALIFYLRTRSIRRKAEFDKQVKQSEITAIKAQMNPHFMFNALNSIQSWVVTKDVKNSNLYLGKFSKLVRKTLEVSEKNAIPLSEEIYIIQLYLDLENLRFSEEIAIDFKVDIPDEEQDDIYVPAMLIQPYIENVFKHGLLHKKGSKALEIVFTKKNNKLICTIQDNGVGRKKSTEINKKKKQHTSFSTKANEKRIAILNEMFNNEIRLDITDAFPEREDCGTLITLHLPLLDFDSLNEMSHSLKQ